MKLKLDENLSRHLRHDLEELGHDAVTVADENLLSQSDVRVGQAAAGEGRILLSLDVEFADLRKHAPGSHPGVVVFRPKSRGALTVSALVIRFAKSADWSQIHGSVVVVQEDRMRVRSSPQTADKPEGRASTAPMDPESGS